MKKYILALCIVTSQVHAVDIYSRVYVAKTDTTLTAIFDEIKASSHEREEILRLNPELRRLERVPAGTILNLSLYRGATNNVSSNLKKLKVEDKRVVKNRLSVGPLLGVNNFKTGLNNDAEIQSSSKTYGLNLDFDIPQSTMFALNVYSQLVNVDFSNVKVKQQTGADKKISDTESRFNYDVGLKSVFTSANRMNRFAVALSRKVEHQYDFTKDKTYHTSDPSEFVSMSSFSAWWLGAEFGQGLPVFNLPLEASLGYSFIMDGNVTSEESSKVRNLKGTRSSISFLWRSTDTQTFGVGYQNFSYRSEFSSSGNNIGVFANFKI